ncbi:MAG: helix-hairpin-helix domain-containing protein [Candidatus Marinimicrobia bacterium]|nr:helix-hairpin-helix domain-containing protein [Candidatus Neomarinimicrobiota bacterium]
MKKHLFILFLSIFLVLGAFAGEKIDINSASAEELRKLPVPEYVVELLEEYLLYHGEFTSVYEIREIKGVPYEEFLALKDTVAIFPREEFDETEQKIEDRYYRLESMMNDEGASEGLVESWIDLFTNPQDINRMDFYDLQNLPAVSPVDAAAVTSFMAEGKEIKSARDLRGIEGISYYGYRNMSDYVRYTHDSTATWNGYFTATVKDFAAQIAPDAEGALMDQIVYDKFPLDKYYKLHVNYGQKLGFGLAYTQSLAEDMPVFGGTRIPKVKTYAQINDISLGKLGNINKLIAGIISPPSARVWSWRPWIISLRGNPATAGASV